jgi:hypothetical protein
MKKGIIKTLLFIVMILLAVVLGKAAGTAAAGVRYLAWLGIGAKFGVSTVTVDLSVVQFTFGMMISINVAQALLLLTAILIYTRIQGKG